MASKTALRAMFALAACAELGLAQGAQPSLWPTSATEQPGTAASRERLQALFNQANRAFEARQWAVAARDFAAFRTAAGNKRNLASSVAAVREGHALLQLENVRESLIALEEGLAFLPLDEKLRDDRILALQDSAIANEREYQFALSARSYRALLPLVASDPSASGAALLGVARTAMFDDPASAIRAADEALAVRSSDQQENARRSAAAFNLRGRAQLISGSRQAAIQSLQQALALAGGLTARIDALDASIRADLGLAHLLSGDERAAHLFIAATGTAQDPSGFLPPPSQWFGSECPDGTSSKEFAVLEFSLARDGSSIHVWPVYTTRLGSLAGSLAYSVKQMRWAPASVARLNPLQARTIRLEAHCTSPEVDYGGLHRQAQPAPSWAEAQGAPKRSETRIETEKELAGARAELARQQMQNGTNAVTIMPLLGALADSMLVSLGEAQEARERQLAIARRNRAPVAVIAELELDRDSLGLGDEARIARMDAMLLDARFASDAHARAFLRYIR